MRDKIILLFTFYVVTLAILTSCAIQSIPTSQTTEENNSNCQLILKGCLLHKITTSGAVNAEYHYTYENNRLVSNDFIQFEYLNGQVSKSSFGNASYQNFTYKENCQVSESIRYSYIRDSSKYFLSEDIKYIYENNLLVEVNGTFSGNKKQRIKYSYYDGTENIRRMDTYNKYDRLSESILFQYDTKHNSYYNLNFPKWGNLWWIERSNPNNVIKEQWIDYTRISDGEIPDTITVNHHIEYNEFDYPKNIKSVRSDSDIPTSNSFEYIKCE